MPYPDTLEGTPMTGIIYVDVSGKAKKDSTGALMKIILMPSLRIFIYLIRCHHG
jgi:hypothetical protein